MNQQFGGAWTEEKLRCLEKYLRAYTRIFQANRGARFYRTHYVDAFAGSGKIYVNEKSGQQESLFAELGEQETRSYLEGSARRALAVEPNFDEYHFVEADAARCRALEELKLEFKAKSASIEIRNSEANDFLQNWCEGTNWNRNRAVVLLDPYGMQVRWRTIEAIAATRGIDLWVLFPLGSAVNRLLTRNEVPQNAWSDKLTAFLGTTEWQSAFYSRKTIPTLFGDEQHESKDTDYAAIGEFFLNRLRTVFEGVAPQPLVLRNSKNVPLFLFCFAAGNAKGAGAGVKIAKDIIGK